MLVLLTLAAWSLSVKVELSPGDSSLRTELERYAAAGEKKISEFFGASFRKDVTIRVLPSRKAFDQALQKQWKMDASQPWMVGAGGAEVVFILSPRAWKSEAQEHDPDDGKAIEELICHELVHTYHSQVNPSRELEGMEPMAWFVEGLATYVSGQLERSHKGAAQRELEAGRAPASLEKAWTGRGRYGIAGSMAKFVDVRFGREKLIELLKLTSNEAALKALGMKEEEFLQGWKDWLSNRADSPSGRREQPVEELLPA